jgi:hypothetical protein
MEHTGIGFDFAKLGMFRQLLEARCEELTAQVEKIAGSRIYLNSPQQVGRLLYDQLGLTYFGRKVTAATQSTNDAVLKRIQDQHEVVGLIREHREASKLLSQYVNGLEKYAQSDRLRCRWMQPTTATGRVSTISPNMQAMAKGEVILRVDHETEQEDGSIPQPQSLCLHYFFPEYHYFAQIFSQLVCSSPCYMTTRLERLGRAEFPSTCAMPSVPSLDTLLLPLITLKLRPEYSPTSRRTKD